MRNLKILAASLALLAWNGRVSAQNETDALRYSQLGFGGTARIQGLAGAQTALGADISTMAGNPAGLGLYRKSEFSFTPGFNFNNTESTLDLGNTQTPDSRNNFNISQAGIVFTNRKPDEVVNKWRSGAFGISFTRLNDFQARTSYSGNTLDENSFLQSLQDQIDNGQLSVQSLNDELALNNNQFVSIGGLAYDTYLIDVDTTNGVNELFVPARKGPINQNESIFSKGAQYQWDFSYGGSYLDKLFIGGSIGLATVRYEQERTYTESAGNEEPFFSSLTLVDYFKTSGTGINFKVGLIYKPVDDLRIGGSIQTPTFYGMSDFYSTALRANYKTGALPQDSYSAQAPDGEFDYNLTTPFRANGGLAYFIGKYGFISADMEYVNYKGASFGESDDLGNTINTGYFNGVNQRIDASYTSAMNYRVGAEARFDIFRIRGGFAHYGDPYKSNNSDRARTYYTVGIGLKEQRYFIDAAYVHSSYNSYYQPYTLNEDPQPFVSTENKNTNFVITGGFNF